MKVVLLGYMASGKSTVGKVLADEINHSFIDLDVAISKEMEMDIPSIFSRKGELFFRKKESEVLSRVLKNQSDIVLSLGGGTPCYANNLESIHAHTPHTFYLKPSLTTLVERIAQEKTTRPMVSHIPDSGLPEFVGKHLFERNPFYMQATHTIATDGMTVDEIVAAIRIKLI